MAQLNKASQVEKKIRRAMEKLGEALDEWLTRQRLRPNPVPIPIDRPPLKRRIPKR
jgi:hypothetical protein